MQYIAPYAGAAMGEYFMSKGKDVLIVYDDLSKHAVAYRTLSLLLQTVPRTGGIPRRCVLPALPAAGAGLPPDQGVRRRLHDRPAHHRDPGRRRLGLYPHQRHFHHRRPDLPGDATCSSPVMRPAVNVGLSVSRVGGAAQTKAMKKTAGTLRIDLAQFRELEVFTQFSLGSGQRHARKPLDHGRRLLELLKQPLYHPMSR